MDFAGVRNIVKKCKNGIGIEEYTWENISILIG